MRLVFARCLATQPRPWENLGRVGKMQRIEGAAHALHGFQIRLRVHLWHHVFLLFTNTMLAGSIAMLVWMFWEWRDMGHPTFSGVLVGAVTGLATITPASG